MTPNRTFLVALLAGACAAVVPGMPVAARTPSAISAEALAQSDLDEFMRQVLARRDENWKKLQQFVLDEHEKIDVMGPTLVPLVGQRRDFRWYIREGYFVRSPVSYNGIAVSDSERQEFEDDFLRKAKEKDRAGDDAPGRGASTADSASASAASADQTASPASLDFITQARPQFIDSAYFLKFKFEQGKYALVGREKFDGRDVLRVEYYPAQLFTDEDRPKPSSAKSSSDRRQEQEIQRLMNKNSLVTLWVEPAAKQIVKYSFDNIQTDFLPTSWLFRLEDIKASMSMSQPFKDVWLPRDVDLFLKATMAFGTIDLRYHLDYVDYKEATTSGRIKRGGLW